MSNNYRHKSFAERVSLGISLFIVGILVYLIGYTWVTGDNNPPILTVTTQANIRKVARQYYVPFTVTNSGGETAESVEIMAKLLLPRQAGETGRQQINFLSRQEEKSGEFIFTKDPRKGDLTVRVTSYKLP